MNPAKNDSSLYAKVALESFSLARFPQLEKEKALEELKAELMARFELNKPAVLERRCSFFNIPQIQKEDYRERVLHLSPDLRIVAGIRHLGGNTDFPFVDVWPGFTVSSDAHLESIAVAVKKDFKLFSPTSFSLWLNPQTEFPRVLGKRIQVSQQYIAAPILAISGKEKLAGEVEITIQSVRDDTYYTWHVNAYKAFHVMNPELKDWVLPLDKEAFGRCREENLLYAAIRAGNCIGLIGGYRKNLLGMAGLHITELLISPEQQGKGYAPIMQKLFIERVGADFEVVWGTIDAKNIPSTRTALRVGRFPVRSEYFIPLD